MPESLVVLEIEANRLRSVDRLAADLGMSRDAYMVRCATDPVFARAEQSRANRIRPPYGQRAAERLFGAPRPAMRLDGGSIGEAAR